MGCLNSGGEGDDTKKEKVAKKVAKTLDGLEWKEFKKLDLDEIDAWFDSVAEVVNTVADLGEACDTANEGILQLCEAKEMVDDGVPEKKFKNCIKIFCQNN